MKIAVRKEEGRMPGGGFHYMTHPIPMTDDFEAECFRQMGHVVIEVPDPKGQQLIQSAKQALLHQLEIAVFVDAEEDRLETCCPTDP